MRELSRVLIIAFLMVGLLVASAVTTDSASTIRLGGGDRFETAALVSQQQYPDGAETVYLANGITLVDSLTIDPRNGPILLVRSDSIPAPTLMEIARIQPSTIMVLGGEGVVSESVVEQAERASLGRALEEATVDLSMGSAVLP